MESPYTQQFRLSQGIAKYLDLEAHQNVLKLHYRMLKRGLENKESLIFTDVIMPPEIFHAMGLSPLFVESLGSFLASIKMNNRLIAAAEESDIPTDICSYHKCGIGALKSGYIPIPKAFVHSSYWCDDMIKVSDYLGKLYDRNSFIIDLPFKRGDEQIDYIAEQMERLSHFLAKETGAAFSLEALKRSIRLSNEARNYWVEANRIRERKHSPMYGSDAMRMLPMLLPKFGMKETVDILKGFYEEIKGRSEEKRSPIKKERSRLLWLHFFPFYDAKLMHYIENELGAVIAFEENCNVYWDEIDENDPFRGLAKKLIGHTGFGSAERRVKMVLDSVERYKIDGVVHFSQICCRPFRGSVSLIKEALNEEGVPLLELSGDVVDSRNYSEGQIKIRIEAFLEMLQNY